MGGSIYGTIEHERNEFKAKSRISASRLRVSICTNTSSDRVILGSKGTLKWKVKKFPKGILEMRNETLEVTMTFGVRFPQGAPQTETE